MTLEAAADLCQLPENAVAEHGITIISYLDDEGHQFGYALHGTTTTANRLGLMQLTAHYLMHNDWLGDEDDD